MKKQDDLFRLIRSLSKSEKGYFKKYSALHTIGEKNNYTKLFDFIDSQEEYDEKAVLKKFHKERFIKQIHVAKNYLYHLILKYLRVYHSGKSMDLELKELLEYVEILYKKQLFKQCHKVLKKAKKIAGEGEQFLYLLEILKWEEELLREELNDEKLKKYLKDGTEEERQMIEKYLNNRQYEWIISEILLGRRQGGSIRNEEEDGQYAVIMNKPVLENKNKALSIKARISFFKIHGFYSFIREDYAAAYKYTKQQVNTMEEFPNFEREYQKNYIQALHNLSLACFGLNKYNEVLAILEKLRAFPAASEDIKIMVFMYSCNFELIYYINTGNFKKGLLIVKELEAGIKLYGEKINKQLSPQLYYQIVYLYFGAGAYSNAVKWLNKILNDKNMDTRSNIYCYSRILNLFIHYELGNIDLLEYVVKSTYRFLYKRNRLYQFESCILHFLRTEVPVVVSRDMLTSAFKTLKDKLEIIFEDPFEKKALQYFDYISWLESKISNRSFAGVVREKALGASKAEK